MLQRELTLEEIRNLKNKVEIIRNEDNQAQIGVKYDGKIVIPSMFFQYSNIRTGLLDDTESVFYVCQRTKFSDLNLIGLDLVTGKIIDKICIYSRMTLDKKTGKTLDSEIMNKTKNEKIISQSDLEKKLGIELLGFNEGIGGIPPYYQGNLILNYRKKSKDKKVKNKKYFMIYNIYDKKFISKEYERIEFVGGFYECQIQDEFDILNADGKIIYSRKREKQELLSINTRENLILVFSDTQQRFSHLVSIIEVDGKNNKYIEKDLKFLNKDQYVRGVKVGKNGEQQVFVFDELKQDIIIYNLNGWTIISSGRLGDADKKYQIQEYKNGKMLVDTETGKALLKYKDLCMKRFNDTLIFIGRNNDNEIIFHDKDLNVIFEYTLKDQFELLINGINIYNYKRDSILGMNGNKLYFIIKNDFDGNYKIIDEHKNCIRDNILEYLEEKNGTYTICNTKLEFETIDIKSL